MVYSTRRFVVCLSVCHFVLVFFIPFSIAITSLGEERANLSAFRTFVRFVLVWICRFSLPLGVWEGLGFVIVALPGPFLLPFFTLLTVLRRWSRCYSYSLVLCGLFCEAICCMSYLVLFCSCVFSTFSTAITSLGEEGANLSDFRIFDRFVLVWICRLPLLFDVWEGLRFVIVALPGLFSYLLG